MLRAKKEGFTLIELLIVIAIIGILAAIILVAVDPAKRLKQSRNARRSGEVYSILNAILNYTVDNKGNLPSALNATTTAMVIGTGASTTCGTVLPANATLCPPAGTTYACANLTTDLVDTYIAGMPVDPLGTSAGGDLYDATRTGYYVQKSTPGNRILVGACNTEGEAAISVKR